MADAVKTTLANRALDNIGEPPIDDIESAESSTAQVCNRVIDDAVKMYLREADPAFARAEKALAVANGQTSSKYDYVYDYPSDCLKAIEIYNSAGVDADKIVFEEGANTSGTSRVILTNEATATLIYIKNITNLTMLPVDAYETIAYYVSMKIAMPVKNDLSIMSAMQALFAQGLAIAQKNNKRGQHVEIKTDTDIIDSRR